MFPTIEQDRAGERNEDKTWGLSVLKRHASPFSVNVTIEEKESGLYFGERDSATL